MKKIATIIVIILLISIAWYSWDSMTKKEIIETPEQLLDKNTQADTVDEIEVKLDNLDADLNLSEDFNEVDAEIKAI